MVWDAVPAAPDADPRELASCRAEDLDVRLARHQFPLGVVAGSLALVLHAGTRLRRVAAGRHARARNVGLEAGVWSLEAGWWEGFGPRVAWRGDRARARGVWSWSVGGGWLRVSWPFASGTPASPRPTAERFRSGPGSARTPNRLYSFGGR